MKKSISLWQLMGFAVTSLGGTLLHFLYEWTNNSIFTAPFSGVNESTWEHMKLLFFPMFVFAIFQSFFLGDDARFWCIKLRGTLLGLALIPVIFYTYNGVIGKSPDWINISIFFVAAAVAYLYENNLFGEDESGYANSKLSFLILCIIGALFIVFTFVTPKIGIFMDPVTGSYGI
ncbi:MAG: DUF6512 family protein [Eubacteriales bacterium]